MYLWARFCFPAKLRVRRAKNCISIFIDVFGIWSLLGATVELVEGQLTKAGGEV